MQWICIFVPDGLCYIPLVPSFGIFGLMLLFMPLIMHVTYT